MKKVLQVSMGEEFGGIEKLEFEYLKNLNNKYRFDFLTPNDKSFKKYEKEIKKFGGCLYNFNLSRKRYAGRIKYFFKLFNFLKKNKYDIIHINSSVFLFSFNVVLISKICGINKIIVHSHSLPNINLFKRIIINLFNPLYRSMIDECLSCSKEACFSLFTKSFVFKNKILILKNGIEVDKYKFNIDIREKYRKKFGFQNKIVYGNVGRFYPEKNHDLLIDIFYNIHKENENSVLLLVGDGILKNKIEEKVKKLKLSDKVIFLGFKEYVYVYLNCMDVFICPSLYEGFGISVLEAQTNGLITYCSKNVSKDVNVSRNIRYFDTSQKAEKIAKKILKEKVSANSREKAYIDTINSGYDIKNACSILDNIYQKNK